MKKILTSVFVVMFAAVALISGFTACGSGGSNSNNAVKNIVGTWEYEVLGQTMTITFNADGSGKAIGFGVEENISYETELIAFQNPETNKEVKITRFTYGIKNDDGSWKDTRGQFTYDGGNEIAFPGGYVASRVR